MDKQVIISNLKKLQDVKPRSEWIDENREFLLLHINTTKKRELSAQENLVNSIKLILQPKRLAWAIKPVAALIVLLSIILGGFATVSAAKNSLPGDIFYNFKRVSEKAKITFAFTETNKARLEAEFAGRRSEELNLLVHKKENDQKQQKVEQAVKDLRENLTSAQKRITTLKNKEPEKAVEVAKAIDNQTKELEADLNQVKDNLKESSKEELNKTIDDAIEAIEQTGDEIVGVIIEKHLSGEVTQEEAEIKGLLEEKINNTQKKVIKILDKITIVNNELANDVRSRSEAGKAMIPANTSGKIKEQGDKTNQSDKSLEEKISVKDQKDNKKENVQLIDKSLGKSLEEKIIEANNKGQDANKILAGADDLLEKNDYQEVINKVQESQDKIKEVKKVIEEVAATIEEETAVKTSDAEKTPMQTDESLKKESDSIDNISKESE